MPVSFVLVVRLPVRMGNAETQTLVALIKHITQVTLAHLHATKAAHQRNYLMRIACTNVAYLLWLLGSVLLY